MNRTIFVGTNLYYSQEYVEDLEENYEQEILELKNTLNSIRKAIGLSPKEESKIPEKINISTFPRHNNSLKKTAIKVNEIIDYLENKGV